MEYRFRNRQLTGRVPEDLENQMRAAFSSENFLDLRTIEEDPLLKQKEQLRNIIDRAAPEHAQRILYLIN
jgi:hypothetical protein